jgi:hypothetical protein
MNCAQHERAQGRALCLASGCFMSFFCWTHGSHALFMSDVANSSERKQKVVVLRELHRAIIYTTEMSKQVKKSHVRDTVHMYLVN